MGCGANRRSAGGRGEVSSSPLGCARPPQWAPGREKEAESRRMKSYVAGPPRIVLRVFRRVVRCVGPPRIPPGENKNKNPPSWHGRGNARFFQNRSFPSPKTRLWGPGGGDKTKTKTPVWARQGKRSAFSKSAFCHSKIKAVNGLQKRSPANFKCSKYDSKWLEPKWLRCGIKPTQRRVVT